MWHCSAMLNSLDSYRTLYDTPQQSPDFYTNLQTGFVGRFEDKVGKFDRISCALCFELGDTFPLTKLVLQNY